MDSITRFQQEIIAPKVSIGMPVYNGEKYIRKAIDSLLSQTFTDFELIISDNASFDNTYTICKDYMEKDSRVKVIKQPQNMGPLWNFKFVFKQAKGKYFMWAAADDIWTVDWIEKLVNKHTDGVAITFGQYASIGPKDEFISKHYMPFFRNGRLFRLANYYLYYNARKANLIYGLYKMEYVVNNCFIDTWDGCLSVSDTLPVLYAMQYGRYDYELSTIFYKREHPEAASSNNRSTSIAQKIKKALFPFETIWHNCIFLCRYLDWDVRIMILFLFPVMTINIIYHHYKSILLWVIKKSNLFSIK